MQVQDEPSLEKPSLYDRLGGVYNIATVVDDLVDRVMVDPRLNANPRVDEAHHRVSAAGFKYLVTELACERSEEHTSELQSLMRTSYAVFCLQKKKNTKDITYN